MTYRPARDIIAQAQSGTGKTGAFVTGSLQIINEKVFKTQAVILAPTHELAIQTKQVLDDIGRLLSIICIYCKYNDNVCIYYFVYG